MSRSDRGKYIAIGLIIGVVIVMVLLVWAVPEFYDPSHKQIEHQTGQHYSDNNDQKNWSGNLPTFVTPNDTLAQWVMATFTFFATCISIWAVILLSGTLKASNKAVASADEAVAETRRIGEAQTRAYVHISKAEVFLFGPPFDHPKVFLTVENTGQTPAKWFEVGVTVRDVSITENQTNLERANWVFIRWNALAGGAIKDCSPGGVQESFFINSYKENSDGKCLIAEGVVRYQTIFDEIFETEFIYHLKGDLKWRTRNNSRKQTEEIPHAMSQPSIHFESYRYIGQTEENQRGQNTA